MASVHNSWIDKKKLARSIGWLRYVYAYSNSLKGNHD